MATVGTINGHPTTATSELGIAYLGDDTQTAPEGVTLTVEGGLTAGTGVTVPGKAVSNAYDLAVAATSVKLASLIF